MFESTAASLRYAMAKPESSAIASSSSAAARAYSARSATRNASEYACRAGSERVVTLSSGWLSRTVRSDSPIRSRSSRESVSTAEMIAVASAASRAR